MRKTPPTMQQVGRRYANLVRNCQFVAKLSRADAILVIWCLKNCISTPVGSSHVRLFGGPEKVVHTAIRYRNA